MAQEFKLPDLGEGLHEAEIRDVLVSAGDQVSEDETVLIVETDKAAVEVPSPYTGVVRDVHVETGDVVEVGTTVMSFGNGSAADDATTSEHDDESADADDDQPVQDEAQSATEAGDGKRPVPASPATRRLARELDVDLHQVEGSGPGGRVTADDVRAQAEAEPEQAPSEAADEAAASTRQPAASTPELPDFTRWGTVERVPLRSVRRTTARRMALAWAQIPHVTHHDAADITALEQLRAETAAELDRDDLTLTIFVLKAVATVLQDQPRFNASLDVQADEIVLKRYIHIGVAVDTDRGLVVPVLRHVDRKSMLTLADAFAATASRTRAGENTLEDVQGGTFTITNVGMLGGTHFDPIINYPQVAILGMARAAWQPVVRVNASTGEKTIEPRRLLPLILAFDHRVVDGADAARFMNQLIALLEKPRQLLVHI